MSFVPETTAPSLQHCIAIVGGGGGTGGLELATLQRDHLDEAHAAGSDQEVRQAARHPGVTLRCSRVA